MVLPTANTMSFPTDTSPTEARRPPPNADVLRSVVEQQRHISKLTRNQLENWVMEELAQQITQKNAAVNGLEKAEEAIGLLTAELTTVTWQLTMAAAQKEEESEARGGTISPPAQERKATELWIDGLWLCGLEANDFLKPAEIAWTKSYSDHVEAGHIVKAIANQPHIRREQAVTCLLFYCATQVAVGAVEEALGICKDVAKEYSSDPRFKEIVAISHHLRGRIHFELEEYDEAQWQFAKASFSSFYADQTRKWRKMSEDKANEMQGQKQSEQIVQLMDELQADIKSVKARNSRKPMDPRNRLSLGQELEAVDFDFDEVSL